MLRYMVLIVFFVSAPVISCCLVADLNGDCKVNMADMAILMSEWMLTGGGCEMLGPEKVIDGTFDQGETHWTAGSGWDLGEPEALYQKVGDGQSSVVFQGISLSNGNRVRVSFDATENGAIPGEFCLVRLTPFETGLNLNIEITGTGSYQQDFTLLDDYETVTLLCESDFGVQQSIIIDNVSVREIIDGGESDDEEQLLL